MHSNLRNEEKIVEKELSYILNGIFFDIQREIGRFCRERQYSDLFDRKLTDKKISFKREYPIEIGGRKSNFVDFFIENRVLVDVKAKPFIDKEDFYQMKRYLESSSIKLGLIVNFRDKYLKPKRVLSNKNAGFVDSDEFVVSHRFSGFTLIELIITITIVAVLAVVGTMNLFGYRSRLDLNNAGKEIAVTLKEAQNRSISQESTSTQGGGSRWGIHFENRATSTDYYDLFWGTAYSANSVASRTFLPTSVTFTNPPSGSSTDVIFAPVTGLATSTVITVAGNSPGSAVEDIIVSSNGKISSNLEEGIVGYWHFDEGAGATTSSDASGYGNTGTLTNGPTWQSGSSCKAGNCLSFDGGNDQVTIGTSAFTTGATAITMWIKPTASQQNGLGDLRVGGSGLIIYERTIDAGTERAMMGFRGQPEMYTPANVITVGAWNFMTFIYNGGAKTATSSFAIYVNGTNQTLTSVGTIGGSTTNNIIGSDQSSAFFNGSIDEVRIYNRALTATEIQNQYNALK